MRRLASAFFVYTASGYYKRRCVVYARHPSAAISMSTSPKRADCAKRETKNTRKTCSPCLAAQAETKANGLRSPFFHLAFFSPFFPVLPFFLLGSAPSPKSTSLLFALLGKTSPARRTGLFVRKTNTNKKERTFSYPPLRRMIHVCFLSVFLSRSCLFLGACLCLALQFSSM